MLICYDFIQFKDTIHSHKANTYNLMNNLYINYPIPIHVYCNVINFVYFIMQNMTEGHLTDLDNIQNHRK